MTMKLLPRVLLASLAITPFATPAAFASPLDLYGGSPLGLSLNGALTTSSEDGFAAYYNPAGLGVGGSKGKFDIQLGYFYAAPDLNIHRTTPNANIPSATPVSTGYIVGSVLIPLGGPIHDKASLGVFFALPQGTLLQASALAPQDPQWLRYDTESERIAVGAGLGVRPIPQLSLGLGVQEFATFSGSDSFNINTPSTSGATSTVTNESIGFGLQGATAPTAGITILPNDKWRIALAYRGAIDLKTSLPDYVNVPNLGTSLDIGASGTLMYSPHTIALGASGEVMPGLTVGLDFQYQLWSLAPVPDFDVSIVANAAPGSIVGPFLGILTGSTIQPQPKFVNTLTPSATVEYAWDEHRYAVRAAYSYRPTYVPAPGYAPTGLESPTVVEEDYLDVNAHIVGLGGTIRVYDRVGLFPNGLDIDLGYQMQILPTATASPSAPGATMPDPVGKMTYGGVVFVGGVALRTRY